MNDIKRILLFGVSIMCVVVGSSLSLIISLGPELEQSMLSLLSFILLGIGGVGLLICLLWKPKTIAIILLGLIGFACLIGGGVWIAIGFRDFTLSWQAPLLMAAGAVILIAVHKGKTRFAFSIVSGGCLVAGVIYFAFGIGYNDLSPFSLILMGMGIAGLLAPRLQHKRRD